MGRLSDKVAFITGAARGQGRSHALTLAAEGAAIIAIDICAQIDTVAYPLSTEEDLAETVRLVEEAGGRILARKADVRDFGQLQAAVAEGVETFGRLDIVVANAGTVNGFGPAWTLTEEQFLDQMDVCCAGVWRTVKAAVPTMLQQNEGGAIVLISSVSGIAADINVGHYAAAKHGVVGLMHNLAAELAPWSIRVNTIAPATVDTPMVNNPALRALFAGKDVATWDEAIPAIRNLQAMPVDYIESVDVSRALLYLVSEDGRYVTNTNHVIDAGALIPVKVR